MSIRSHLRGLYLAQLSHPAADRTVYRAIRRGRCRQIVELGVGLGLRALRMIELAAHAHAMQRVAYTGIDLFESRGAGDGPGLSLKEAHKLLKPSGAQIRLVPGDPLSALSRTANALGGTELLVISADQDERSLAKAWFYVPRLLIARSIVLVETRTEQTEAACFRVVGQQELLRLAAPQAKRAA